MDRAQQRALFQQAIDNLDTDFKSLYQGLVVSEQIPGMLSVRQEQGPAIGFTQIEPSTMRGALINAIINEDMQTLELFGVEMPEGAQRRQASKRMRFVEDAVRNKLNTLETDEDVIEFETELFPIIVKQKTDTTKPKAMKRMQGGDDVIAVISAMDFDDTESLSNLQKVYNRAGKPRTEQQIKDQLKGHRDFMGPMYFGIEGPPITEGYDEPEPEEERSMLTKAKDYILELIGLEE